MNKDLPSIGFGITSWRSPDTLAGTLGSYSKVGLNQLFDDSVICLQDASPEDKDLCEDFGMRWIDQPNRGIAESMRRIARELNTDLVLFLENDCPVVEEREAIYNRLNIVKEAFQKGQTDIFRLRHRWNVGEMFAYSKYLKSHRIRDPHPEYLKRSTKAGAKYQPGTLENFLHYYRAQHCKGRAIYVEAAPEQRFPEAITKMGTEPDEWFVTDSRYLNWTNQSCVVRREWFLNTLMPYVDAHPSRRTSNGFQSPERPLNCHWWRKQRFKIGVGTGIFTHTRIDGSWRPSHNAYEPNTHTNNPK